VNEGSKGGSPGLSTVVLAADGKLTPISQRGGRGRRLRGRGAVRRSHGAQDGGDEAGGGPAWTNIMEVLGGGQCKLVGGERHEGRRSVSYKRWPVW
jgi:hypothetical protein